MEKRQEIFNIKGMRQDISESIPSNEFSFENYNIRLTTTENNTLFKMVNERGEKEISNTFFNSFTGNVTGNILTGHTILGTSTINNYIVLFTIERSTGRSYIIRLEYVGPTSSAYGTYYFRYAILNDPSYGPPNILNFSINNPIETLSYYENEEIQKVYWIDGINQLRCINIIRDSPYDVNETFDVSNDILDFTSVIIQKESNSQYGSFPSGTVQYVFTGINYYGAESNISYISPLHYTSRDSLSGGSPEEINTNIFRININIDNSYNKYEFIRVYSIIRTSINGVPLVKHLQDIKINSSTTSYNIIDDNSEGSSIAPTDLYFIGSKIVIPNTMTSKNNTLFLGNYKIKNSILEDDEELIKGLGIAWTEETRYLPNAKGVFPYKNNLDGSSYTITHFKKGEWYRFGLMFQYPNGEYSEVKYIGDYECPTAIKEGTNVNEYIVPIPYLTDGTKTLNELKNYLVDNNIINVIPVVVYTDMNDCSVIAQGVCNPTIYNVEDRANNAPFSQPSWFFRPYPPREMTRHFKMDWNLSEINKNDNKGMPFYQGINLKNGEFKNKYNKSLYDNYILTDVYHDYFGYSKFTSASSRPLYYLNDDYSVLSKGAILNNYNYFYPDINTYDDSSGIFNYKYIEGGVNYVYPVPSSVYDRNLVINPDGTSTYVSKNAVNNILPKGILNYRNVAIHNKDVPRMGSILEFHHDFPIPPNYMRNGEIQSNYFWPYTYVDSAILNNTNEGQGGYNGHYIFKCYPSAVPYPVFSKYESMISLNNSNAHPFYKLYYRDKQDYINKQKHAFFIDHNIITFHSPDIEFNESYFYNNSINNLNFRVVGIVPIHSNVTDYDIIPEKGPMPFASRSDFPRGFVKEELGKIDEVDLSTSSYLGYSHLGYRGLCSIPVWEDDIEGRHITNAFEDRIDVNKDIIASRDTYQTLKTRYVVYPWHSEFLNNGTGDDAYGRLKYKIFCNNRYSYTNVYFNEYTKCNTKDIIISNPTKKINYFESAYNNKSVYYGTDIDKIVLPFFNSTNSDTGYPIIISGQESLGTVRRKSKSINLINSTGSTLLAWTVNWVDTFDTSNDRYTIVPDIYYSYYKKDAFSGKYRTLKGAIPIIKEGFESYYDAMGVYNNDLYNFCNIHIRRTAASSLDIYTVGLLFGFIDIDKDGYKYFNIKHTSIQPSRIKYKTSQHALISFGYSNEESDNNYEYLNILPKLLDDGNNLSHLEYQNDIIYSVQRFPINDCNYFWMDENSLCKGSMQHFIKTGIYAEEGLDNPEYNYDPKYGYLVLGELYRAPDPNILFGGISDTAIENNKWIIAGNPTKVNNNKTDITDILDNIIWKQGDFYYQRYNHTLAYPSSQDDKNSIVDTLSFMVETRINIDGVYSKQKAPFKSWINFEETNKLNQIYSQANNFFIYYAINPNKIQLEYFPNNVTWTLPKIAGSVKDNWLNVQLVNTLDLDGTKGILSSLKTSNNNVLAFQENAISKINYNDRVQINTSDKVPIEIANSGKVDGYLIISDKYGSNNKWTIVDAKTGLFFVDSKSNDICRYRENIENLSINKGMRSFFKDKEIVKVNYDPILQDVYYKCEVKTTAFPPASLGYECISYNEILDYFSSLYDYEYDYSFYIKDKYFWIHKNLGNIYMHREGDYYKHSYFTILSEGTKDRLLDKVFTGVDFISDSYHVDGTYYPDVTYNDIRVWNEYQDTGIVALNNSRRGSLRKKFRTWHIEIPRNQAKKYKGDRIRNPWSFIKLYNNDSIKKEIKGLRSTYYIP